MLKFPHLFTAWELPTDIGLASATIRGLVVEMHVKDETRRTL